MARCYGPHVIPTATEKASLCPANERPRRFLKLKSKLSRKSVGKTRVSVHTNRASVHTSRSNVDTK
jgi:hypothetical protein